MKLRRTGLPPEVLADLLLSPVTALECAQSSKDLPTLAKYRTYLRPLRSTLLSEPESYSEFMEQLQTEEPEFFKGMLDSFAVQCLMHPPFVDFHLARCSGAEDPNDVRDSMQLIVSQEILFITGGKWREKTVPPACQVVPVELDVDSILSAIRIVNAGLTTAV